MRKKIILGMFFVVIALQTIYAQQYEKKVHRSFEKSGIMELDITNKYGNIEITDHGDDFVTIDAVITVTNANERKASEILSKIDIIISQEGTKLKVQTTFAKNISGNFSINYIINIPSDRNLTINNKYGNVVLQDLNGNGKFEIAYGNFTCGSLNSTIANIELAYGKADIKTFNTLNINAKYSKIYLDSGNNIDLISSYSDIETGKLGSLKIDAKYGGIKINEIDRLLAESRYTNYTISLLNESFTLTSGYGTILVNKVNHQFKDINITNTYGSISLGLNNVSYNVNVLADYCKVNYPPKQLNGNINASTHGVRITGSIGSGEPHGNLKISSRYGNIDLTR